MNTRTYIDRLFEAQQTPADKVSDDMAALSVSDHIQYDLGGKGVLVELHSLSVDKEFRGQGLGRAFMKALCASADKHGATIELEVGGEDSNGGRLLEWYGSLGFVWKGGYMQRLPRRQ